MMLSSKELLQHADKKVAEINKLKNDIEYATEVFVAANDGKLCFLCNGQTFEFMDLIDGDRFIKVEQDMVLAIGEYIDKKEQELKQLLGIGIPKISSEEPKYPEMTLDAVKKLYIEEGKTYKEMAEYFGVNKSYINNFIFRNRLKEEKEKYVHGYDPKPEPIRTHNDTEKCRVCGKEIQFTPKMTRDIWPYKYKRKQDGKTQMLYCCDREHFYAGQAKDA